MTTTSTNESLAARKELLAFELYHHGLVPGYTNNDIEAPVCSPDTSAVVWRADNQLRVTARALADRLEEAMLAHGAPLLGTGLNAQLVQKSVTWLITEPAKQVYTLT